MDSKATSVLKQYDVEATVAKLGIKCPLSNAIQLILVKVVIHSLALLLKTTLGFNTGPASRQADILRHRDKGTKRQTDVNSYLKTCSQTNRQMQMVDAPPKKKTVLKIQKYPID